MSTKTSAAGRRPHPSGSNFREGRFAFSGSTTWYQIVEPTGPAGGPPVVLLHGGPGSTSRYLRPLTRIAETGRTVVLYDQTGCGRSMCPGTSREWCVQLFESELTQLRRHLGLTQIHLWGCSWGGMLALEHALRGASGIRSLMLSSTPVDMKQWEVEVRSLVLAMPTKQRRSLLQGPTSRGYSAAIAAFNRLHGYRGTRLPRYLRDGLSGRNDDVYASMVGESEWSVTGSLREWSVVDRLGRLTMPVQLLYGRYDFCTSAVIDLASERLHRPSVECFSESGHTPFIQQASQYCSALVRFMDEVDNGFLSRSASAFIQSALDEESPGRSTCH